MKPHLLDVDANEVVSSLAQALSCTAAHHRHALLHHGLRVGYTAARLAEALGHDEVRVARLLLAADLHDCGISTERDRLAIVAFDTDDCTDHAERGARLLEEVSVLSFLAPVIRAHHHRYAGGNPDRIAGGDIPLDARILHLADRVDVLLDAARHPLAQRGRLIERITAEEGRLFDPALVAVWRELAREEAYWFELFEPERAVARRRRPRGVAITLDQLDELAALFGKVVDAKSPFTLTHSLGVAQVAEALASRLGHDPEQARLVHVAGLLHDLGKLGVPDAILDKPGRLTSEEYDVLKRHAFDTYSIISSVRGLEQVARWAGYHHERLDGNGYPFRIGGADLPLPARVMAVADVFQALNQDRPYREAMPRARIVGILQDLAAGGGLDPDIVDLVLRDWDTFLELARPGAHDGASRPDAADVAPAGTLRAAGIGS